MSSYPKFLQASSNKRNSNALMFDGLQGLGTVRPQFKDKTWLASYFDTFLWNINCLGKHRFVVCKFSFGRIWVSWTEHSRRFHIIDVLAAHPTGQTCCAYQTNMFFLDFVHQVHHILAHQKLLSSIISDQLNYISHQHSPSSTLEVSFRFSIAGANSWFEKAPVSGVWSKVYPRTREVKWGPMIGLLIGRILEISKIWKITLPWGIYSHIWNQP